VSRTLSVYLDLIRFLAALGVLLGHSKVFIAPALPKVATMFASECVIVFFVLSGLVIRYVTTTREHALADYAFSRAVRIYSVVIIAVIATAIFDHWGFATNAGIYRALDFWDGPMRWEELGPSLAFLNEAWRVHIVMGTNEAYWSLGFEVAYYIGFAVFFVAGVWRRAILLLLWSAVFGPTVALYGLLWLLGVGVYDLISRDDLMAAISRKTAGLLIAAPLFLPLFKFVLFPPFGSPFRPYEGWQFLMAFGYYFTIALLFACHLVGFAALARAGWTIAQLPGQVIRWAAGATFTIYLAHQPLLVFLGAVMRPAQGGPGMQVSVLILALAILFGLAELGERRKAMFRTLLSPLLGRTRRPRGATI
jgi:peptidoglycan/LPS O-acetylase OafA/YrhL